MIAAYGNLATQVNRLIYVMMMTLPINIVLDVIIFLTSLI